MAPGFEHRILHGILRIDLRPEHADCQAVRRGEKRLNQKQEGLLVATAGFVDERRGETHSTTTIPQPGEKSRMSF